MAESKHHAEINETQYRRYISFFAEFQRSICLRAVITYCRETSTNMVCRFIVVTQVFDTQKVVCSGSRDL